MKLIRLSTDLKLTAHEFPSGTHREQNDYLRGLIGNRCRIYEHVRPKRLYSDLHMKDSHTKIPGQSVSMLIDEEGRLKENFPNLIGSYLYETDIHGCPIMGNILFVGEEWSNDGIDFCGIEDSAFRLLERQLKNMILAMAATLAKEALER